MRHLVPNQSCSASEHVNTDDDLPVCIDLNGDDWEHNFLAQLGQPATNEEEEEKDEDDDHELDKEPVLTIHTFSEAMASLDNVKLFLESKSCIHEAITIGSAMDGVASANIRCMRQTKLLDFVSGHTTNSVTDCGVAVDKDSP